jgi:PAS domain S-box-containing protein
MLAVAGVVVAIVRAFVTLNTDRRSASLEIADQQLQLERFRALVDASSDFIAIAGTDGSVLYVNPAGRRIVGLEPDADVSTTTIADYLTEEGLQASLEIEQPAVMTQGHWEGESTLRDLRGGPPTPVAIASFVMLHPRTGEPWLLATVQRDISETLEAERSLQELADQRQALLERLVQAEEEERARIAADVHDDSVQALAAVELRMLLLRREVERCAPELLPTLEGVRESVSHATDRLRHLLFDLESPARRTDLANALADAAAYVFEDAVRWSVEGDTEVDVPEGIRVTAYRIAREAMVNVRKHADADRVRIGLERTPRGVEVTVSDDGVGIDPVGLRHRPGHLGIAGMRERAAIAGGGLEIESRDEGGTTVRLWLPEPTSGAWTEEPVGT